jgi:hypothetical protein
MKATFNQHIGIFENAIPKEWCEEVIKIFEDNSYESLSRDSPTTDKDDKSIGLQHYNPSLCNFFDNNFWENIYPLYSNKYKLDGNVINFPMYLVTINFKKPTLLEDITFGI